MDHVKMLSQSGPACKPVSQVQTHIECTSNDIINDKPPENKFVGKSKEDFNGYNNDLRGEEHGDHMTVDKLAEEFKKSVSSEHFSNGLVNGVDNCLDSNMCKEEHNKEHSGTVEKEDECQPCVKAGDNSVDIEYVAYQSELQMPDIMRLIQKDLSEPYSIYTYRYFIHNWPKLCFLAMHKQECVGAIVCKLDVHRKVAKRGYIAMLAVDEKYRKRSIGSNLVLKAIAAMVADDADEVVLETEITNQPALRLYENLGFVRDKRLFRYYLNGVDALRLKLWLR